MRRLLFTALVAALAACTDPAELNNHVDAESATPDVSSIDTSFADAQDPTADRDPIIDAQDDAADDAGDDSGLDGAIVVVPHDDAEPSADDADVTSGDDAKVKGTDAEVKGTDAEVKATDAEVKATDAEVAIDATTSGSDDAEAADDAMPAADATTSVARPDATTGAPDAAAHDAAATDAAARDAAAPDAAARDAAAPDAAARDAAAPDAANRDAAAPDAAARDASAPDAANRDAAATDAANRDASAPDAAARDAAAPDAAARDAAAPDATGGSSGSSDAGPRDASAPDATNRDAAAPDATNRDAAAPDATNRDAAAPDATNRDAAAPDATNRDAAAPDATNRDAAAPDATNRDAAAPDATNRDAAARDAAAPDAAVADAQLFDVGPAPPIATFPVTITMKDVSGSGATAYPVSVVIPLPEGQYQDTSALRVTTSTGAPVPAQFEVLTRHWAKDNSIRNVLAHFQTTVGAVSTRDYVVDDLGGNVAPPLPATIVEDASTITVDTGALNVVIDRSPFRIHTPSGELTATLRDPLGIAERSFDASNITITVEERGPMRVVIRAEAPAIRGLVHTTHGWAIRLYAYAGSSDLKVDYQLQNSPKNVVFAPVVFFDSLTLDLDTADPQVSQSYRAENVSVDPFTLQPVALVTPDVTTVIRRFYETWPNGLSVDPAGVVSAELFPSWSQRRYQNVPSATGLHWIDDMEHVVKEVLFHFGPLDANAAADLSRNFDLHPVGVLPVSWYNETHVTLDLGGAFPARTRLPGPERLRPNYMNYNYSPNFTLAERLGWDNFGLDLERKSAPNAAGSWPYSVSKFFITQCPEDYYAAEDFAMAELNTRPEWIAQYDYATDYPLLHLSENPYGSWSWRYFDGVHGYSTNSGYLPGTDQETKPRDDEHSWFYQIEETYYITGNPWIRDYYRFIGQYRRTRLHQQDPYPDMSARAMGHSIAHALQAYRVTGDVPLLTLVGDYIRLRIRPIVSTTIGGFTDRPNEAMFQIGYLSRALVSYLAELQNPDPIAVDLIRGFVSWNMIHSTWGYYVALNAYNGVSHLTSMSFVDEQIWYALQTNNRTPINHAVQYCRRGFGGGDPAGIDLSIWEGDFFGRISAPIVHAAP